MKSFTSTSIFLLISISLFNANNLYGAIGQSLDELKSDYGPIVKQSEHRSHPTKIYQFRTDLYKIEVWVLGNRSVKEIFTRRDRGPVAVTEVQRIFEMMGVDNAPWSGSGRTLALPGNADVVYALNRGTLIINSQRYLEALTDYEMSGWKDGIRGSSSWAKDRGLESVYSPLGIRTFQAMKARIPFEGYEELPKHDNKWKFILHCIELDKKGLFKGVMEFPGLGAAHYVEGHLFEINRVVTLDFKTTRKLINEPKSIVGVNFRVQVQLVNEQLTLKGTWYFQDQLDGTMHGVAREDLAGTAPKLPNGMSVEEAKKQVITDAQVKPAPSPIPQAPETPRYVAPEMIRTSVPVEGFATFKLWTPFSAVANEYNWEKKKPIGQINASHFTWTTPYWLDVEGRSYAAELIVHTIGDSIAAVRIRYNEKTSDKRKANNVWLRAIKVRDYFRNILESKYGVEANESEDKSESSAITYKTWIDEPLGRTVDLSHRSMSVGSTNHTVELWYYSASWFNLRKSKPSQAEMDKF